MAELVPSDAVLLLYRRYLKAAVRVPNGTIRMLLMQQVKNGFRRNIGVRSPLAQRELISASHKDLAILEDDRHQPTLYINRFGVVSCMEWECRRTEWHLSPKGDKIYKAFFLFATWLMTHIMTQTQFVEDAHPDIAKTVDMMAMKLECDNPDDLWQRREKQYAQMVEGIRRQRTLEDRILTTFHDAPEAVERMPLPTLANPTGSRRIEAVQRPMGPTPNPEAA